MALLKMKLVKSVCKGIVFSFIITSMVIGGAFLIAWSIISLGFVWAIALLATLLGAILGIVIYYTEEMDKE